MMHGQLRSAEFVYPGHPDKLADAIADALVQEATRRERRALVGVEVAVHRGSVFVTGRIACQDAAEIDVAALVGSVYRSAGYGADWEPDPDRLHVQTDLCIGPLGPGEAESRIIADDQSICVGYAVARPQTNYLPVEHWLANRLGRRLAALRLERRDLKLGPDGKILVIVRQGDADPDDRVPRAAVPLPRMLWNIERVSCSVQQRTDGDEIALHRAVRHALESELEVLSCEWPGLAVRCPDDLEVNGAGAFDVGGPIGDNGLSGKKLVVDAYGPGVPIGGGALSGKDFFKADRAGALHARRIAKAIVMTGVANEATVTLEWVPGVTSARVLAINADGSRCIDPSPWTQLFDLSLAASGEAWTNTTDLMSVATHGHFTSSDLPWERLAITAGVAGPIGTTRKKSSP
jgi:S-adenosylmethionine synthetase